MHKANGSQRTSSRVIFMRRMNKKGLGAAVILSTGLSHHHHCCPLVPPVSGPSLINAAAGGCYAACRLGTDTNFPDSGWFLSC